MKAAIVGMLVLGAVPATALADHRERRSEVRIRYSEDRCGRDVRYEYCRPSPRVYERVYVEPRIYVAPAVVYAPAPVYVAPAPVYVAPPVYYAPPPVVVYPRYYYPSGYSVSFSYSW